MDGSGVIRQIEGKRENNMFAKRGRNADLYPWYYFAYLTHRDLYGIKRPEYVGEVPGEQGRL